MPPRSERATLTEHWIRHGDYLTLISIIDDPVYLTEPFIRTSNFARDAEQKIDPFPCESVVEVAHPDGYVPHHLPGTNPLSSRIPPQNTRSSRSRAAAALKPCIPKIPVEAFGEVFRSGPLERR